MDPTFEDLLRLKLQMLEIRLQALNFAIDMDLLDAAKNGKSVELRLAV